MTGVEVALRLVERGFGKVLEAEAHHRGLLAREVFDRGRSKSRAAARRAVWAWLYRNHDMSLPDIGRLTGHDHTTVLVGIRKHEEQMAKELKEMRL